MYDKILLTLDNSPSDRAIIEHVKQLAAIMHSRVVLLHVATGVPAQWSGPDAGGEQMTQIREYLDSVCSEFGAAGVVAARELAYGEPAKQIVKWVQEKGCDLLAMGTHGHGIVGDLLYGTTASRVQHSLSVPVLLLRSR